MAFHYFDRFWHSYLGRPYKLHTVIDEGSGTPVILLHGIGSSGNAWRRLVEELSLDSCRVVAFDLLGFGQSPKPDWPDYSVDDHARAVIATMKAKKLAKPVVIVGHSMGCLVAAHVAKLEPRLVKHLILYEMPLYAGLPETRTYKRKIDLYLNVYNRIVSSPFPTRMSGQMIRSMISKLSGFDIREDTWVPFVKSLENTIIRQSTLHDIKQLSLPIDIIYGSLDMLVIRGTPTKIFGREATHVQTQTITQFHAITPRSSRFLAGRIRLALSKAPVNTPALSRKSALRKSKTGSAEAKELTIDD